MFLCPELGQGCEGRPVPKVQPLTIYRGDSSSGTGWRFVGLGGPQHSWEGGTHIQVGGIGR